MKIVENSSQLTRVRLLRERVYEELRADIIKLRLQPGTEIREAELAQRFDVSKSPVRDALMRLEQEALVITTPRQGYRVAPISLADVQDMFHLRGVLERACVERIVRQATDEQIATLEVFRRFEPGAGHGDFIEYNRAFHRALAELSGNARLRAHLIDIIDQMERAVLMSVNRVKQGSGNTQSLVDEHCHIIDALQERELKRAERLVEQHIGQAGKRVHEAISRSVIAP